MSTFAVFGMTRDQALSDARKTVKTSRMTPSGEQTIGMADWLAMCEKRADEIMAGSKVKQLSPLFDAPQFATQFVEMARRSTQSRSLQIRYRSVAKDATGNIVTNKKTGAPKLIWRDYQNG